MACSCSEPYIFHGGGVSEFGTKIIIFPERKWGCAMLANTAGTSNMVQEELSWHLIDELLGIPFVKRTDWRER